MKIKIPRGLSCSVIPGHVINILVMELTGTVQVISYEKILPVWRHLLWPDRQDPIEPMSAMSFPGGFDGQIFAKYQPTFFGYYHKEKLIAVNSGHRTSDLDYRSRGLYVDPEFRKRGLAQKILEATVEQGTREGAILVWSYPRRAAIESYLFCGFLPAEFSPETETHCYVWKKIGN